MVARTIDPRDVTDTEFLSIVELALARRLTKRAFPSREELRLSYWDYRAKWPAFVDLIASGYRATDAEIFATFIIANLFHSGALGVCCVDVGEPPSLNARKNVETLSAHLPSTTGTLQFDLERTRAYTTLGIRGPAFFAVNKVADNESDHVVILDDVKADLSIGAESACNTLRSLSWGFAVARWPTSATTMTVLCPLPRCESILDDLGLIPAWASLN